MLLGRSSFGGLDFPLTQKLEHHPFERLSSVIAVALPVRDGSPCTAPYVCTDD
jgi:hypothetical protein